jgi:hypothetical protein
MRPQHQKSLHTRGQTKASSPQSLKYEVVARPDSIDGGVVRWMTRLLRYLGMGYLQVCRLARDVCDVACGRL